MNYLQQYAALFSVFCEWAAHDQETSDYVNQRLALIQDNQSSNYRVQVERVRDAALQLFTIAQQNGFILTADLFYTCYEECAVKLLY